VAFRPTITRGLALSANLIYKILIMPLLEAILMPKENESSNSLISKGLFKNRNFMVGGKVAFFVSKNDYLATIVILSKARG
jgi:hypothetical protein